MLYLGNPSTLKCFGETIILQPLKIIQDIEDRLNGKYSQKTKGLPLSVEGQVDALIKVNYNTYCQ